MKFTSQDITELRKIVSAARVLEIEGIVIADGMVGGARIAMDGAIVSPNNLSISEALKIGIGRVNELDKRLGIFGLGEHDWQKKDGGYVCSTCGKISKTGVGEDGNSMTAGKTCPLPNGMTIEGKENEAGDVSVLTITSGKSKIQFRCTSVAIMQYPKSNDDTPIAIISLKRDEVQQIVRSVKALGSESVTVQVTRSGVARIECVDVNNDKFETELSTQVKYVDEETSLVQSYSANLFVNLLDHAVKEVEEAEIVVGEIGSMTAKIKGHSLVIFPLVTGEE